MTGVAARAGVVRVRAAAERIRDRSDLRSPLQADHLPRPLW